MNEMIAAALTISVRDHIDKLEALSLGQMVPDTDYVTRKNDKRPASVLCYIPDSWSLNIKGNDKLNDLYLMVRIPREIVEEMEKPEPLIYTPTQEERNVLSV